MNLVILMGRLTKDPDIRYTQGNRSMAVARYTIAVDEARQNQDGSRDANYIQCVSFDKLAEFAERYMHKGKRYAITGRWKTGSYTDRSGNKVYTNECYVDSQEFADGNDSGSQQNGYQSGGYQQNRQPAPQYQNAPQEPQFHQQTLGEGFMSIPEGVEDEGLPFN